MIRRDEVYKIGKLGKPHGVKGEITFAITDDVFDRVDAEYLVLDIDGILVPFYLEEYRFKNDENVLSAIDPILFDAVNVKGSSDQKSFVSTISAPDKSKVDKCTVIKAAAQHEDGTYSDVVTNTYFVGDMAEHIDGISESCKAAGKDLAVMSISMDADDLFDSAKGIYVKGDTF